MGENGKIVDELRLEASQRLIHISMEQLRPVVKDLSLGVQYLRFELCKLTTKKTALSALSAVREEQKYDGKYQAKDGNRGEIGHLKLWWLDPIASDFDGESGDAM